MKQNNLDGVKVKDKQYVREETEFVDHMLYIFQAPVISHPGWPVAQKVVDEVMMNRMISRMDYENKMSTEHEAMAYISSASMIAPLDNHMYKIYAYLFNGHYPKEAKEIYGEDLEYVIKLQDYEKQILRRLREWIFKKQMEHMKSKIKREEQIEKIGKPDPVKKTQKVLEQVSMGDFT